MRADVAMDVPGSHAPLQSAPPVRTVDTNNKHKEDTGSDMKFMPGDAVKAEPLASTPAAAGASSASPGQIKEEQGAKIEAEPVEDDDDEEDDIVPHPDEVLRQNGQTGLDFAIAKKVTLADGQDVLQPARVQQNPVSHVRSDCA